MIYQVSSIIEDVRVCMDENITSTALYNDTETLSLDQIIQSKIVEAVDRVHTDAPYYKLDTGVNMEDLDNVGIHWKTNDTCGWILLPADFLRLVVFEMSDWERPVYGVVTPADPEYTRQYSRHKGIRGTAQRPVCVLGVSPSGRVLEFYSCKTATATVSRAVYIPRAAIEFDNNTASDIINVSRFCYEPMKYMAAGLTLATQGDNDRAKLMMDTANNLLQR